MRRRLAQERRWRTCSPRRSWGAMERAGPLPAAVTAAATATSLEEFIHQIRLAVAPYDQRTGHVSDDAPLLEGEQSSDVGKPSRLASIEELPVALAALTWGQGDFARTIRAGVFYGRDCDSIASMACGLFGALHGMAALPVELCAKSNQANRRDFSALAADLSLVVAQLLKCDEERLARRRQVVP